MFDRGKRQSYACSLCGSTHDVPAPKKRGIYGHPACKPCWMAYVHRRFAAFVIDGGIAFGLLLVISYPLAAVLTFATGDQGFARVGSVIAAAIAVPAFLVKDALFEGRPPGRALMGLRVIDRDSGASPTVVQSLARTWVLLLPVYPYLWLWLGLQLQRRARWGEGLSRTRVVWDQHATATPFLPKRAAAPPPAGPQHAWGVPAQAVAPGHQVLVPPPAGTGEVSPPPD